MMPTAPLDDTRIQLRQVYALTKNGQPAEAFALLKPILEQQPDNAEAWWLMVHAAPTPDEAALACEQVLRLKSGFEAAQQKLNELTFRRLREMAEGGQRREAYLETKAVVTRQPGNAEAWWLAAQIAPMRSDAIAACQKVLALNPDHAPAQEMFAEQQKFMAESLLQKAKASQRPRSKRRVGCWLGLSVLFGLSLISLYMVMILTGNTFGLPIGAQFNARYDLQGIGTKPTIKGGTLIVGATHDYRFYAGANSVTLILVTFPTVGGNPGKAVKLYNANNELLAVGNTTSKGSTALSAMLTQSGTYSLRLTGTYGAAQGAYVLQIAVADMGGVLP